MIGFEKYKDRAALVIDGGTLRATFLPEDGAKMASLIDMRTGKELLLTKEGARYRVLDYDGSYVDAECSAFDDMFPTIDPYTPSEGAYRDLTYPDHGEVCRLPFSAEIEGESICFAAESRLFPISYRKCVRPTDEGLAIDYTYENRGNEDFPFIWAGHMMLRGEDGMRLCTPFAPDAPIEMVFATEGYPHDTLPRDRLTGFDAERGAAYKFYYTEPMREGFFRVTYPDGRELSVTFDAEKIPYLGVWINNGEFQGIYNIAPEACTLPFDAPDKAASRGYTASIPAKSTLTFTVHLSIKHKEKPI